MRTSVHRSVPVLLIVLGAWGHVAMAQEPKSAALAKELSQLLDEKKLDAIAAKDPSNPEAFVAALYFSGSQLLVVGARYEVPVLLTEKLTKKEFRDVYLDLSSASIAGSKNMVMDIGVDGLRPRKEENRIDTCDIGNRSVVFDGDWKKQKFDTEADYDKMYADAEARYARLLGLLIAQAKKL